MICGGSIPLASTQQYAARISGSSSLGITIERVVTCGVVTCALLLVVGTATVPTTVNLHLFS
jgi:hypothetical protein